MPDLGQLHAIRLAVQEGLQRLHDLHVRLLGALAVRVERAEEAIAAPAAAGGTV